MLMAIADDLPSAVRLKWTTIYASFVQYAWNADRKRFRNFMGFDRQWLEREGSADSNARTIWALAIVEAQFPNSALSSWAATLIDQTIGCCSGTRSPRTSAFLILAMAAIRDVRGNDGPAPQLLNTSADLLLQLFQTHSRPGWVWFEPYLSYDNYRLPEAMIVAGRALGRQDMIHVGYDALHWLVDRQTGPDGIFRPVATQEFGIAHSELRLYDQQPIEAWAAIDAAIAACALQTDKASMTHAMAAHAWFTGANDANQPIADSASGHCYDGINEQGVNQNRGAESVLAWQFAHRRIRTLSELDSR